MTTPAMLPAYGGGVLVASPNTSFREQVRRSLHHRSGPVHEVSGGADALVKLESGHWQLLFLDRRLPDLDAEELIQIIKVRFPGIEVIVLDSDGGKMPQSFATTTLGFRSCVKPALPEFAVTETGEVLGRSPQPDEMSAPLPGMIGCGENLRNVYRLTRLVAPRNTTVLIRGATGTGKELVARAIHQLSPRSGGPWMVVNCAAIPETLLESELFGYVRGAFTGAVQAYAGKIHAAQGGTLFLDEVGELPLSLQAKLLRFLDAKEVQRLGSTEAVKVDVRIIAATNARLEEQVDEGRFRSDLYFRLSAFPLELPSLDERPEDILPLAQHFLRQISGKSVPPALTAEAVQLLRSHTWRGNVRELQQVIERAAILVSGGNEIAPEHLYFLAVTGTRPTAAKNSTWRTN